VVLIHGLGGNHAFWYWGVARPLARHHPVLVYDLRGHGRSELVSGGYSVDEMTGDLLALLHETGVDQAHLVGHSFGGSVALNAAIRAPERVLSLTLVDVILRCFQPQTRLADYPNWDELQKTYQDLGVQFDGDEEIDFRLLEALAGRSERQGDRREPGIYLPFESWNGSRRAAERWRRLLTETSLVRDVKRPPPFGGDDIAALRLPMLAVYGALTYALPSLEGLARVQPDLEKVVIPGVGHFIPALAPQALLEVLAPFFERCETGNRRHRMALGNRR
jgi:pimeloyl-ACP methyl ester carboxylesterase